jgi:GT2 family glycosyltransferase
MKNSYGLGLITYNNLERFRNCISNIPYLNDKPFVVINDGESYDISEYRDDMVVLQHQKNKKIAKSKNDAIQYLLGCDVDWIFIMENDMLIKDPKVFDRYIEVANDSGVLHLNFALHGNDNWNENRVTPIPRLVYNNGLTLYRYTGGCFQLYHKSIFEKVGLYDEYYINCWEHLDLTFRTTLAGYHTPFWLSADVVDSHNLIEQLDYQEQSKISSRDTNNFYYQGLYYWKFKFGSWVADIKDWVYPEYHTDIIVEMFRDRKYDELSKLFMNYYRNDNSPFFNKEYKNGHVYDNVYGKVDENSKLMLYQWWN